jgi:hypothetical protein
MMTQIIEFFKAVIFFSSVTFMQVNIISWLIAFPISVVCSYIYNYSDVIRDDVSVGKFTKDYFVRNWLYMLKLLMKMSLFAGVLITILYYLRQTV